MLEKVDHRALTFGKVKRTDKIVSEVALPESLNSQEVEIEVVGAISLESFAAKTKDPAKSLLTLIASDDAKGIEKGTIVFRKKGLEERLLTIDWMGFFE